MATAQSKITIGRSPDDVWAVVGDFGGITWMPGVESCSVEGDVRTLDLMGMTIRERLNRRDDAARQISYSIVDGPLPVESHTAVVTVTADGDGSTVTWDVDVEPDDLLDVMEPAYEGALEALKRKLEG